MIRAPKVPTQPCTCGTCRTCTDPLSLEWASIRTSFADRDADDRLGGRKVTVPPSVAKTFLPPVHRIPVAAIVAGFNADMAALRAQVRGDGMQPRTSERGDV